MAPTTTAANTASGTAYTIWRETLSGYGMAVVMVANAHKNDTSLPTILYLHGAGGSGDQFATLAAWQGFRDWCIDNGIAIVEGSGGTDDVAGQQNWGNNFSRTCYEQIYPNWAQGIVPHIGSPWIILGRSMGGVSAPYMYLQSALKTNCAGLIVNSGVQSMTIGTLSSTDNDQRPTGQWFSSGCYPAYGVNNYTDFKTASASNDPYNIPAASWTGKNVIQLYGDADHTVPHVTRGCDPIRAKYVGLPAIDSVDVRPGGDHSGTNGSYLQVSAMTKFMNALGFGAAPAAATYYRVTGRLIVTDNTGGSYKFPSGVLQVQ